MRGVALACVLAACGNDAGLLLDVHPGDPSVARVEVLLPGDEPGTYMGLPPSVTGAKIQGPVYAVVDRTSGTIDSGGALRVLLTPGAVSDVPAILVLGYDADNTPIRYAVVTDPNGAIHLPYATSAHLVVELEPITSVPLANAATSMASPRLVRWDGTSFDGPTAKCFGILSGTGAGRTGIFFGPDDDLDCDHAQPECDDTWYLRVRGASSCATTMPPTNDATTMDACRLGASAGCRDGSPDAGACVAQEPAICVPAEVCDQCGDGLDPSCVGQQMTDLEAGHIECTIYVKTDAGGTGAKTFCDTPAFTMPMAGLFGNSYTCSGMTAFADPMSPGSTLSADLPLDADPADRLTFACHGDTTDFVFGVSSTTTTPLDPTLPETTGALVIGVHSAANATSMRLLGVPIHITYMDVGDIQSCPTPAMQCDLAPDVNTGADDPLWHCAGS